MLQVLTVLPILLKDFTLFSISPSGDPKKTDHLLALDGAKERLHLFKANLLEEGSFDAGVAGCECVFHTASPFYHEVNDPQVCTIALMFMWFYIFLIFMR